MQADLGSPMRVKSILIQGRGDRHAQWVKTYIVAISNDGQTFDYVTNEDTPSSSADDAVVFEANTDQTTVVEQELPPTRPARFVRLYPQTWHRHISLRWEVMACSGTSGKLPA